MSRSCTLNRLAKRFLALAAVFVLISASEARCAPNFVLIFMDDQGYQDVGVFGSKTIKTPHLDNMAREGMKFTDFYSLAPVCSPSRAGLMTGCYPPRVGITGVLFPRHNIGLNPEETTVAIAKRLVDEIAPRWLRIGGYWYPRGGMPIDVFYQTGEPPKGLWIPDQGVAPYKGRG